MSRFPRKHRSVYPRWLAYYCGNALGYMRHVDFLSIYSLITYRLFGHTYARDRIAHSGLGTFYCRGNTTDFLHINPTYEKQVKKFISEYCHNFNKFFDVGACMGEYSVWLASQGFRCYAFEPCPQNYDILQKNISLNNQKENIEAFNVGLGNKNGRIGFHFNPINTGMSHVLDANKTDCAFITICRLDDIFPQLHLKSTDRILIKIDAEGMELEVLKGATNLINKFKNVIIFETAHSDTELINTFLLEQGNWQIEQIDECNSVAIQLQ